MKQSRSKTSAAPDLLPWQAVLMIACVTAAGLFHEHPRAVRPLPASVQAASVHGSQLRSGR